MLHSNNNSSYLQIQSMMMMILRQIEYTTCSCVCVCVSLLAEDESTFKYNIVALENLFFTVFFLLSTRHTFICIFFFHRRKFHHFISLGFELLFLSSTKFSARSSIVVYTNPLFFSSFSTFFVRSFNFSSVFSFSNERDNESIDVHTFFFIFFLFSSVQGFAIRQHFINE